ncbi:relaxase/mobilization nuclease domain-containing protein [Flavobacterium sp. TMP13]|uniref:relaxase/mobilization nuclease domain-containing protein n=1 Tax=Flavobacterium sp. TMP13 TaxID=3425950 RepID=UPI003D781108
MIAKINTGSYTAGMVKYNHDKTKIDVNGQADAALIGIRNIITSHFESIVSTISDYNSKNTMVQKPNIHISLSFYKDDILDNQKMQEIANDYMNQMGYSDQPYAIYRHFDKEHPHLHIVSSKIQSDGKKVNDSHIYYKSQALTRRLEEKYGITKVVRKIGVLKEKDLHKAIYEHLEHGKHSLTGILSEVLYEVLDFKPTTDREFEKLLESYQVQRSLSYDKDKNIIGNYFDLVPLEYLGGKKQFKKSRGVKGFSLDPNFQYEAIQLQLSLNAKHKAILGRQIMRKIYSVLNPIVANKKNEIEVKSTIKLSELKLELKKKGIELITKRTQSGENLNSIYGLLFRDKKTRFTYSATDIKLKTIDFLKLIDDDEKNKSTSKISFNNPNESQTYIADFKPVQHSIVSALELFSSLLSSNSVNTQDNESLKKRKKRRRLL